MIASPPKTIEEFTSIRNSILDLMENPYCDQLIFISLTDKLAEIDAKIEELGEQDTEKFLNLCK